MASPILTALLFAGAGLDSGAVARDSSSTAQSKASEAVIAEDAAPEEKRVVARFETVPPGGGKRPSAWSGTGRTWVWVGAAGLGVAGAVIGYHYLVDGEVPKDQVISLTD